MWVGLKMWKTGNSSAHKEIWAYSPDIEMIYNWGTSTFRHQIKGQIQWEVSMQTLVVTGSVCCLWQICSNVHCIWSRTRFGQKWFCPQGNMMMNSGILGYPIFTQTLHPCGYKCCILSNSHEQIWTRRKPIHSFRRRCLTNCSFGQTPKLANVFLLQIFVA